MDISTILARIVSACSIPIPSAIDLFLKWRKQLRENHPPQLSEENKSNEPELISVGSVDDARVQVSRRLYKILALLNQNRYGEITISELAEFCGYKKTSDLEKYFQGLEEPTNKEKEKICSYLGVNPQWFKHGKEEPFTTQESSKASAEDYLEIIKNKSPKKIIFVRSRGEAGRACIVLKLNEFKYIYLPSNWNISGHVGQGGQKEIYSLYKLVITLQDSVVIGYQFQTINIKGNHINKKDFDDLVSGRIYPGSIVEPYNDYWWDDLTDIDHIWSYAPSYEGNFGTGFIEAQEIIKDIKSRSQG